MGCELLSYTQIWCIVAVHFQVKRTAEYVLKFLVLALWQIVAVGEFLEAPEKLSSAGSTNFSNVMQYLVSNEVYSVAQYLLNTAVDAGHVLMWNGEPLQQSNIDLATFQRSAME